MREITRENKVRVPQTIPAVTLREGTSPKRSTTRET